MIVFVLGSMFAGLTVSGYALFAGAPILLALLLYASTGIFILALVLLRAFICQQLSEIREVAAGAESAGHHTV